MGMGDEEEKPMEQKSFIGLLNEDNFMHNCT